jgi:putative cardiolipin synthase
MRAPRFLYGFLACATIAGALAAGCNALPRSAPRVPSVALTNTGTTRLGTAVGQLTAAHPGRSGYYPLSDGRDAFAARALLARAAQRSLDIQYYIWHDDITGILMFNAVRAAAERGVRVRLLLDDNNTSGLDQILLALDAHPNIEIRLFNPFAIRSPRALGYLTDFFRLNRRMHNKAYIADNQVGIVGGRNIGDEYFGAASDTLFVDLDVMTVGPVVQALSRDFDRYWNSASAYPVAAIVPHMAGQPSPRPASLPVPAEAQAYRDAVQRSPFVDQLVRRQLPFEWATTRLVSDDPAKVLGLAAAGNVVAAQLRTLLGTPRKELNLVSPYFVPGRTAASMFESFARSGVRVRILTNALEATDVAAVHAGYAKWRKELLAAGVSLYELKRFSPEPRSRRGTAIGSSSASSLHAKTFSVDDERAFVGSFNLDRRSVSLNTELGLVIESPTLARQLSEKLTENMPELAYEVRLDADGKLYWIERSGGKLIRYDTEPGTDLAQRISIRFLSWLPIDWLL